MGMPLDPNARKYYRVAFQRIEEAEIILMKVRLPAVTIYLTGYSVECILKSLLIVVTPIKDRIVMFASLKNDFGHNLRRLRAGVIERRLNLPDTVSRALVFVSTWSPELRYEPGPGDVKEARRFLRAARSIVEWADGRM